ncbi:Uncharacterised protein [Mycobacterium tuberculosis]|nr:Uncharacterised protein [Mycobacterium tuberculosis]
MLTSWPVPVRARATSAAQMAAAKVMPAEWSPIPPRWKGGVSPGRVSRLATPARDQKAATS